MKTIVTIPVKYGADEIPADHEVEVQRINTKVRIILDTLRAGEFSKRFLINWVDADRLHEYCKTTQAPKRCEDTLDAIFLARYIHNIKRDDQRK